jgi:hypothetical protein
VIRRQEVTACASRATDTSVPRHDPTIIGLALGVFLAVTVARIEAAITAVLPHLSTGPQQIELIVTTVTLSQTLDNGLTLSLTFTQRTDESDAQFRARVKAEWAAYVAEFGG